MNQEPTESLDTMDTNQEREYQKALAKIKKNRPPCTNEDGHNFVSFHSSGEQVCPDCGLTEDIIYKMEK